MKRFAYASIAFLSIAVSLYALGVYTLLPVGALVHPDMKASYTSNAFALLVHVFSAVFALLLGSVQFSARLRGRYPRAHRMAGRLYLGVGVALGGASGLYLAFHAFGGPIARAGFALLAAAWLHTGWQAYRAIRRGDVPAHRAWMVRNWSLTLAAVTLRIYLPLSMALGIDFATAYAAIAWLCWVPNLLVAQAWLAARAVRHPAAIAGAPSPSGAGR